MALEPCNLHVQNINCHLASYFTQTKLESPFANLNAVQQYCPNKICVLEFRFQRDWLFLFIGVNLGRLPIPQTQNYRDQTFSVSTPVITPREPKHRYRAPQLSSNNDAPINGMQESFLKTISRNEGVPRSESDHSVKLESSKGADSDCEASQVSLNTCSKSPLR